MDGIKDFHAHIYFDVSQLDEARALAEQSRRLFGVAVRKLHEKPVGPHPRGSCQHTVAAAIFGAFATWVALNRGELTVFAHADTGKDLTDHSRNIVWFGPSEILDLSIFSGAPPPASGGR